MNNSLFDKKNTKGQLLNLCTKFPELRAAADAFAPHSLTSRKETAEALRQYANQVKDQNDKDAIRKLSVCILFG